MRISYVAALALAFVGGCGSQKTEPVPLDERRLTGDTTDERDFLGASTVASGVVRDVKDVGPVKRGQYSERLQLRSVSVSTDVVFTDGESPIARIYFLHRHELADGIRWHLRMQAGGGSYSSWKE